MNDHSRASSSIERFEASDLPRRSKFEVFLSGSLGDRVPVPWRRPWRNHGMIILPPWFVVVTW
jgi:hypothetical protein